MVPQDADPVLVAVPSKTTRDLAPVVMLFGVMCAVVPLLALAGARQDGSAGGTATVGMDWGSITRLLAVVLVPVGIALVVGGAVALKKSRGTTVAIGSAGLRARLDRGEVTVPWDQLAAVWIDVISRRQWTRYGWRTPVESWIWLSFSPAGGSAARGTVAVRLTTLVWAERHDSAPTIALADHALRRFAGSRYQGVRSRS